MKNLPANSKQQLSDDSKNAEDVTKPLETVQVMDALSASSQTEYSEQSTESSGEYTMIVAETEAELETTQSTEKLELATESFIETDKNLQLPVN